MDFLDSLVKAITAFIEWANKQQENVESTRVYSAMSELNIECLQNLGRRSKILVVYIRPMEMSMKSFLG